MSRDYANKKPSGKKRSSSRGKKPQQKRSIPYLPTLIVLLLVGGFGYFLWWISGSSDDAPATTTAPAVTVEQTKPKPVKKDPNALPPKPTEEWTYLEELENKSIDVEVPEDALKSKGPYQMQCASFRKLEPAEEMKAMIAFQGMEAQVRATTGSSGVWHKVILGPFESKRAAERSRHKLQRAGINGCQIWLWEY
ncbi:MULTISPECIES: SPOR domain-containing protein [unclassified Shewanella]|uniref:SPOR domain-containing protein n=1 Tax=unclassified Shewanella TaxID=196818 RepID=UPI0006D65A88|nr:SPOR domain-containing protein [Shewanella sp. P1-14-1]KPZ73290.1 Cell division protein FtsN [Shewanella sp. P1-14-1]